jgi:ABC-type glycerol-3-phosphate transport system substrate-binding protein
MRRTAVLIPLAALVLAGCSGGGDEPTVLSVTTPGPSATAGAATTTVPPTTTAVPPTTTAVPTTTTAVPAGPRQAYQVLATDWQRARGVFITAISENVLRPVAQQRALAGTYLRAQQAFATGLAGTGWPAGARPAVRALLAVNKRQEASIAAMASAPTSGAFTTALGRYGTLTGPENAAVAAVATALD